MLDSAKPKVIGGSYYNSLNPKLLSYRIQSIDLLCKSIDWFLYDCNFGFNELKMILSVAVAHFFQDSSKEI